MYAVIKTGGKQYQVHEGQTLKLELLEGEPGSPIEFKEVLMVANEGQVTIGTPLLSGASVSAEILGIGRRKKITIIKSKRRKHSRKRMGHRQWFTQVKITAIKSA